MELGRVLPHVLLFDVAGEPARYRIRVAGTWVVDFYGEEITGRAVDELRFGAEMPFILDKFHEARRAAEPTYAQHRFWLGRRRFLSYERLLLPLASDGRRVDMILGGIFPIPRHNPS